VVLRKEIESVPNLLMGENLVGVARHMNEVH
jgi:hypothetical protein